MDGLGAGLRPVAAGVLRDPGQPRGQLGLPRVQLRRDAPDQRHRSRAPTPGVATGTYQYIATAVYATWTAPSLASANVTVVDVPPPYVVSLATVDPSPTKTLSALHWTVTFSSNVTGVNSSDFAIANTGLTGTPVITSVTGSNATYTVTASSGTGTGTLGINLVDNGSIVDAYNQPLGDSSGGPNGNFTGQTYTVDRIAPTNSLSLVSQSGGGSFLTGTTVFYRGTGMAPAVAS